MGGQGWQVRLDNWEGGCLVKGGLRGAVAVGLAVCRAGDPP